MTKVLGYDVTQHPILHVDMTPSDDLVIRILKAYLENTKCRWSSTTDNPLLDLMNEHQDKREKLLVDAIDILENHKSHM